MKNRRLIRGFAVCGALVCAAMLAATVVAQPAPVRVVQASDGSLHVVQGSNAWLLVPDQISDADLAALTSNGEVDGTLPASLFPTPVPPPAPAAPAPQPAPAAPAPPPAPAPAPAAAPANAGPPTVTIQAPNEGDNLSAKSSYTISGTVTDPAGAGGIDTVDIWIFGERNARGASDLGTAILQGDGSWSLTFSPTKFSSTHTNIYVYAHSKITGKEGVASRGFNIVG